MKIFLDSSFIISMMNKKDPNYENAMNIVNDSELLETNQLYASNLIINEVVTKMGERLGLEAGMSAYELIRDNCSIINEFDIANFNEKVLDIYRMAEGKLTFTDCSIIVIIKELDIDSIISFDKELKKYI